jgi:hypothetical protein
MYDTKEVNNYCLVGLFSLFHNVLFSSLCKQLHMRLNRDKGRGSRIKLSRGTWDEDRVLNGSRYI